MAKILLIDDDPNCIELLTLRLKKERHEVREATDGENGLRIAGGWLPDLIMLDIRIPKIDGWEVCRYLKSQTRTIDIPIIMLTGCSQDIQEQYGRQCGADAYMVKPWEWPQLLKTIDRMLRSGRTVHTLKSDVFRQRIKNFIQRVAQQAGNLTPTEATKVMGEQVMRFATAAIVQYEDAVLTPLYSDFVQKIKLVRKDMEELDYWLGLIRDSKALASQETEDLLKESRAIGDLLKTTP